MNGVLFFSVTCRTEKATRLENGPISTHTPWSMSRAASELPSSTFCWVSPGEQRELGPAQRLDAAGGVDLVHGELQAVERELGLEGQRARSRAGCSRA